MVPMNALSVFCIFAIVQVAAVTDLESDNLGVLKDK